MPTLAPIPAEVLKVASLLEFVGFQTVNHGRPRWILACYPCNGVRLTADALLDGVNDGCWSFYAAYAMRTGAYLDHEPAGIHETAARLWCLAMTGAADLSPPTRARLATWLRRLHSAAAATPHRRRHVGHLTVGALTLTHGPGAILPPG